MKIRPVGAELFLADRRTGGRTDMTKLILRTRLKIKRHVHEMCSEVTKDYSKLVVQVANTNREQARLSHSCGGPVWIRRAPTARQEAAEYELSAKCTVTDVKNE